MAKSALKKAVLAPLVIVGDPVFCQYRGADASRLKAQAQSRLNPNTPCMSASVNHTADTASEAQAVVDRVMSRLLAGVDELPVAKDSIDAGQIRIQPRYRWNPRSETQEFEGYEATRVLGFKLTSLESLGDALQMLSEQGATTL